MGHSVCDIVWKLATFAVIVLVLRHYDGRRLDRWTAGFDRAHPYLMSQRTSFSMRALYGG